MAESNLERAENRVREMNEMAQNYVRQSNNYIQSQNSAHNQNQANSYQNQSHNQNQHNQNHGSNHQNSQQSRQQNNNNHQQNTQQSNNMWNIQNNRSSQNISHMGQPRFEKVKNPTGGSPNHNTSIPHQNNNMHGNIPPNPPPINMGGGQYTNVIENILGGLPFNLKMDDEKIIIIALIILLSREKADIKLIIALAYLIM